MWEMLGNSANLTRENWPSYREDLTREEQIEIPVQINGRVRGKIVVDEGLGEEVIIQFAKADPRIAPLIAGKEILRMVVVPKKLVNIVLK